MERDWHYGENCGGRGEVDSVDYSAEKLLIGKKAIVFYPDFFGYGDKIIRQMKIMGIQATLYNSRAVKSAVGKAMFKVFPEIVIKMSENYFDKILKENRNEKLDYILVIERLPIKFLKTIKKEHPNAKLILYMDDSIKNLKGIERRFKYFDKILSFDREDSKKYKKIQFRPLFYSVEAASQKKNYKYDLCFIGTSHSDRYFITKQIRKQCTEGKFYCYLYLQSEFMFWLYKITKRTFRHALKQEFSFKKMDYKKNIEIEDTSKVILDIQHPAQTGLTMRTIEMIGLKKKIITTNQDIVHYDFYRPENIQVIDRKNAIIDKTFFDKEYVEISRSIYEKYSIRNWVLEILGDNNAEI